MELTREEIEALRISRDEWQRMACQEELRADALEIERDQLRMQVKAAEVIMDKVATALTADTDAGLDALCAIQSWQITPTKMYYRNEAEMQAARAATEPR